LLVCDTLQRTCPTENVIVTIDCPDRCVRFTGHAHNNHTVCFFVAPIQIRDVLDFSTEIDMIRALDCVMRMNNGQHTLKVEPVFGQRACLTRRDTVSFVIVIRTQLTDEPCRRQQC
jgi:hypothetical protein